MTVRKTKDIYIRRRRVPLAEVCCSVSQNFRIVYANEIGQSSVEVVLACGGVGVGGVATLPAAVARKIGRASNEKVRAPWSQMRGLKTISMPRRNGRGPDSYLKRLWIFV